MKNQLSAVLMLLGLFSCYAIQAQEQAPKFNLDFENESSGQLPDRWLQWGSYQLSVDSVTVQHGKKAIRIDAAEEGGSFGSIAYRIPAEYAGAQIKLEGYIKTRAVEDGFAGLLLRIDGDAGPLEFDNMQQQGLKGTTDWKQYNVTLPLPEEGINIFVAGILVGKGTAWFDNFNLTIDGKDIQTLQATPPKLSKAQMDKEFDAGSRFQTGQDPSSEVLNRLHLLAKVWGFVKYHHPAVGGGTHNWDYELFRILPAVEDVSFSEQLTSWLQKPGVVEAGDAPRHSGVAKLKPDLDWLKDPQLLNDTQQDLLAAMRMAPQKAPHYYIGFAKGIGNPIFRHEKAYAKMKWEDTGYRLLALFRYWNMIEYFFPYKHLMDEDWDDVLRSSIPEFLEAGDELSYKLAVLRLIGKVQDTHANIWQNDPTLNRFHGVNIAPVEVNFIEGKAVVVRTLEQLGTNSGIAVGDVITHINGREMAALVEERIAYCPASNHPTQMRDVARRLLRTNEDELNLSIDGSKGRFDEKVSCLPLRSVNLRRTDLPSHKNLDGDIGYIYPGTLQKNEIHQIMKKFGKKKGLIVDLRCYPSDFIVFSLGNYLMPKPTAFVKFTAGSMTEPGLFSFGAPLQVGTENPSHFKGKVAILVNETTQSQAEYTTMALRVAPKARVFGSTTAAADGNVSEIILPGRIRTMISGIGVYYPDGTETQRIGIVPDEVVQLTIRGIRAGQDEVLEKAKAWLEE